MHEAGGWIKFFMRIMEAELLEYAARRSVVGMMSGKKGLHSKRRESELDDASSRLRSEAHAPVWRPKIKPHFEAFSPRPGRTQPCAAGVLAGRQKKHGPILHAVRFSVRDLAIQLLLHLFRRERSANEARDFRIPPDRQRQGQVAVSPMPECQTGSL